MKQITEDYVSFEIAKLLKEKGFDEYCLKNYWSSDKELHDWKWELSYNRNSDGNRNTRDCAAPTQSLALKWLREVHKIFVEPFVAIDLNGKYHYCFRLLNSICKDILEPKDLIRIDFKDTYEQAVEAAILYVLKNLI